MNIENFLETGWNNGSIFPFSKKIRDGFVSEFACVSNMAIYFIIERFNISNASRAVLVSMSCMRNALAPENPRT